MPTSEHRWLSLLFLRVTRALDAFQTIQRMDVLPNQCSTEGIAGAVVMICLKATCLAIDMGGILLTLEILGDIPGLEDRYIEVEMGQISFVTIIYWVFTTISTVGYGDFSPATAPAQLWAIVTIVVGVVFFTIQTAQIVRLKAMLDTGGGSYRANPNVSHVVVTGGGVSHFGPVLLSFLAELFPSQMEHDWPEVVLLVNASMDPKLGKHLNDELRHQIRRRIFYFQGTSMNSIDLDRVGADQAKMVFVLANASAPDPDEEDGENLLRALAVKAHHPSVSIRLMLLKPESSAQAINAGIPSGHCFSVHELKVTILAHCCRCRGYLTFLSNLMDSEMISVANDDADNPRWMKDYCKGSDAAIYGMVVPAKYEGLSWRDFAIKIYREGGVIACAMQIKGAIVINPAGSVPALATHDVVFVIAAAASDLTKVSDGTLLHHVIDTNTST
jgi:hypothetical protein